jgi:N-acetylgalactosamine kinase
VPQDRYLYPVGDWVRAVETVDSPFNRTLLTICAGRGALRAEAAEMCARALEVFGQVHGMDRPVLVSRSAGRVNVLGTHIDHRGGSVNPVAIRHMWLVAAPRQDDWVVARNVQSDRFPEERFRIRACLPWGTKIDDWGSWCIAEFCKRRGDASVTWSNYVRAAILYLQHIQTRSDGTAAMPIRGMDLVFYGNIPPAVGLSSSSAVVVAAAEAVVRLNGLPITRDDLVTHCGLAERYVGTHGGCSDHAAIVFGRSDAITHITAFPLTVDGGTLPEGYRLILANSLVAAEKRQAARNIFNSRIAAYEIGLLMIRKHFPEYAGKLEHLRDVNPERLGVDDGRIYQILRTLPSSARRSEILRLLPECEHEIQQIFRTHDESVDGYPIRQICLYGIAECLRADMVPVCLKAGDMKRFGALMNISHDGDRVTRCIADRRLPIDNGCPTGRIDALMRDFASGVPERVERARLWRQPGGYGVSVPEVDKLVDIALATPGVLGAGLVGAGMGGCMVAAVEAGQVSRLMENLTEQYYRARGGPVAVEEVTPVGGLHTFSL